MLDSTVMWSAFIILVAFLLVLDLGVLNRGSEQISTRKAIILSAFWISIGLSFSIFSYVEMGPDKTMEYLAAYVVEEAMSVDNLFVFILIFSYFNIPDNYQHKALFYGIIGALFFRAIFIFAGVGLLTRFHFILYIFGALLLYAAIKTMTKRPKANKANSVVVWVSKHVRSSDHLDGDRFFTTVNGVRMATPLLLCVIAIEFTDIVFALDSIPAVLAISTDTFIVYTSNIFAILGLRSLYFVIRGSLDSLAYLKYGLGIILAFVGVKMIVSDFVQIDVLSSLAFIGVVLLVTVVVSIAASRRQARIAE
jgi:tellurite resistance protein TerC